MWFARFQILICEPQSIWGILLGLYFTRLKPSEFINMTNIQVFFKFTKFLTKRKIFSKRGLLIIVV